LPRKSGTYALLLGLAIAKTIQVGKLGRFDFPAGYYLYTGSALGSGGLAGRLNRHTRSEKRRHWHIDYLARQARIEQIWYTQQEDRREHEWAALMQQLIGATVPAPGFGASDCKCPAHLFFFREKPDFQSFQRLAGRRFPEDTLVKIVLR
jgi:Uri superfamily endonuclease